MLLWLSWMPRFRVKRFVGQKMEFVPSFPIVSLAIRKTPKLALFVEYTESRTCAGSQVLGQQKSRQEGHNFYFCFSFDLWITFQRCTRILEPHCDNLVACTALCLFSVALP